MDTILQILEQLEINNSVFIQLFIVFIVYFIAKNILFKPLQKVIEKRIEKTTKAESSAEAMNLKFGELEKKYNDEISLAHKDAQLFKNEKKLEIDLKLNAEYKEKESLINKKFEESRKLAIDEVEAKKEVILSSSDELASELLRRIEA